MSIPRSLRYLRIVSQFPPCPPVRSAITIRSRWAGGSGEAPATGRFPRQFHRCTATRGGEKERKKWQN